MNDLRKFKHILLREIWLNQASLVRNLRFKKYEFDVPNKLGTKLTKD